MVAVASHNEGMRYVALLRGINVGTANRVKMADLLAALEASGVGHATTYLQSGNVLFEWKKAQDKAEQAFNQAFGDLRLNSTAILRDADQMTVIASNDVFKGRAEPEKAQFITFLKDPYEDELQAGTASELLLRTPTEIYWVATPREGKAPTGPKLPKHVLAQSTNRNWIVTRALAELLKMS
jgi:uncharacterized protein (DUF1697 family)